MMTLNVCTLLTGFWKTSPSEEANFGKGVKVDFSEEVLIKTIQLEKQGNDFSTICLSIDDATRTCSNHQNDNPFVVWNIDQIAKVFRWTLPLNEYVTVKDFKIFYEVVELDESSTPAQIKSQLTKPRYDNGVLKFAFDGKEYFKISKTGSDHGMKTGSLPEANELCSRHGGTVVMPKTIEQIDFLSDVFLRYWRQSYQDHAPNSGTETQFWINLIRDLTGKIIKKLKNFEKIIFQI